MLENIKIRKTKKSDIKTLSRIYKDVYEAERYGEKWNVKKAETLLRFYFNQKTFIGLTALYEGKVCGAFFSCVKPWWDGDHLAEGELFIGPRYQKKGIGTELYAAMMKTAYQKGCIIHELVAYKKPSEWYKKIGFKETELKYLSGNIKEIITRLSK